MGEKVKGYWEKAKEVLKKIPRKIFVAVGVLVAAALVVVIWLNTRPYAVLFTELNSSDLSSILSYLEAAGVTDYKVEDNDTILVAQSQEDSLRARLLMEGYPQSGFAFVYPIETGALSTESERQQANLSNLMASLSNTVRCFDNVQDAIVYINPGEDRGFVLDSNNVVNATATVTVEMENNNKLSSDQAAAIRNLIAHAVAGLKIEDVSIQDTIGNTYSTGDSVGDSEASALKLQLEEENENSIRTKVMQVLTPFFGEGNVRVSVNCTVDINQTVTESTDYYLPPWAEDGSTNGRGIIGSRVFTYTFERPAEDAVGGTVGTETNSDIEADFDEYVEDLPDLTGNETLVDVTGQTDYVTSNTKKQIIQTAGYLTDCTISVSINSRQAGAVDVSQLMQHVARASGIVGVYDEDGVEHLEQYISIISEPFFEEEEEPYFTDPGSALQIEMWMIYAAAAGLLLFLILLIIILRARSKRKKKKKAAQEKRDMEAFLAAAAAASHGTPQEGADVMSMQSERSVELRKDIRKFAEDNPEIAAQMLKGWLRGDDDNG